jgi:hypothetical protein
MRGGMVGSMKTTIDIAEPLLAEAKQVAASERVTLRELVEEGLRVVLTGRRQRRQSHLRDASFKGQGVQPGVHEGDWETIRDMSYEGRGS